MTTPQKPTVTKYEINVLCPPSEVSQEFLQGMADRMTVSYYKYGAVHMAYPHRVDAIKSLQQRLDKYKETGNTEFLIDAANFAMIEFMYPSEEEAHFTPTDSDASPGRTGVNGEVTANTNKDTPGLRK